MRAYLKEVEVPALLDTVYFCEGKVSLLEEVIKTGLDSVLPLRSKTVQLNEPPWVNSTLKNLIAKHQTALTQERTLEFKQLRNQVNRERKSVALNITKPRSTTSKRASHPSGGKK